MSSSVRELSDTSEADEQQNNSEPQQSSTPTTELSNLYITSPNIQYPTPPNLAPGNMMGQAAYPYPDPYYRSIFAPYEAHANYPTQSYPAQPMVQLQLMGIQQAGVPLPSDAVEGPVFVNAKQYHGILRRRQSRAKAELENKALKSRKIRSKKSERKSDMASSFNRGYKFRENQVEKLLLRPYLHESRHQHALKRARGCGGRFLNSKETENQHKEDNDNIGNNSEDK